jgi:hypothetical protein
VVVTAEVRAVVVLGVVVVVLLVVGEGVVLGGWEMVVVEVLVVEGVGIGIGATGEIGIIGVVGPWDGVGVVMTVLMTPTTVPTQEGRRLLPTECDDVVVRGVLPEVGEHVEEGPELREAKGEEEEVEGDAVLVAVEGREAGGSVAEREVRLELGPDLGHEGQEGCGLTETWKGKKRRAQ